MPRGRPPVDDPPEPPTSEQRSGETDASEVPIESLIDRYQQPLLSYAHRMNGGDWSAAHDAVQETFVRLCKTDRGKIQSRIAAWLFAVCRTRVIDMHRTRHGSEMDPHEWDVAGGEPTPEQDAVRREDHESLAAKIETLSPRQREVVRLRFSGGLSYREIAEVTGLTVSNVGFHLHAAVKSLRQSFA